MSQEIYIQDVILEEKKKKKLWGYGYIIWIIERERERYLKNGQDLGAVFRCCYLGSLLKNMLCGFFVMGWMCIF